MESIFLKYALQVMLRYAADRRNDIVIIVGGPAINRTEFSIFVFCDQNFEVCAAGNGTICGGHTQGHSQHCRKPPDNAD